MSRKARGDMMVRNFEKRNGLPKGSIRDPKTGRAVRGDCTLFALRARFEEEEEDRQKKINKKRAQILKKARAAKKAQA